MGNGAKAAQKRERNQEKAAGAKGNKSQAKTNEAAKNIICQTCRQAFFITTRPPELTQHAENKHGKTLAECFPEQAGKA